QVRRRRDGVRARDRARARGRRGEERRALPVGARAVPRGEAPASELAARALRIELDGPAHAVAAHPRGPDDPARALRDDAVLLDLDAHAEVPVAEEEETAAGDVVDRPGDLAGLREEAHRRNRRPPPVRPTLAALRVGILAGRLRIHGRSSGSSRDAGSPSLTWDLRCAGCRSLISAWARPAEPAGSSPPGSGSRKICGSGVRPEPRHLARDRAELVRAEPAGL